MNGRELIDNQLIILAGIVADAPDNEVFFHSTNDRRDMNSSSLSSLLDANDGMDPFDFSVYMDQVTRRISSEYTS